MVADQQQPGGGGGDEVFEGLDPKLTIYALANGMDLVKRGGVRSLEWYRDGLERGILIEAGDGDLLSVTSRAWKTNDPESGRTRQQRDGMTPQTLVSELSAILQGALDAANEL